MTKSFPVLESEQAARKVMEQLTTYPDRRPVVLASPSIDLMKQKYLVDYRTTFGELHALLRKSNQLSFGAKEALFLLVEDKRGRQHSVRMTTTVGEVFREFAKPVPSQAPHDPILALHLYLLKENTFGCRL
jgi:hypothetical protein